MSNSQTFLTFWKKQLPDIKSFLESDSYFKSIQLAEDEFTKLEKREKYSFNLEYLNGSIFHKLEISAIAKDLDTALNENKDICNLIDSGHFNFKLTSSFVFKMSKLT